MNLWTNLTQNVITQANFWQSWVPTKNNFNAHKSLFYICVVSAERMLPLVNPYIFLVTGLRSSCAQPAEHLNILSYYINREDPALPGDNIFSLKVNPLNLECLNQPTELPNYNLRKIGQRILELWLDIQTYKHRVQPYRYMGGPSFSGRQNFL